MAIPPYTLVFSNKGELAIMRNALYVTGTPPRNWRARLYSNDYTPDENVVTASVTECVVTGYAAANITGWSDPTTVGGIAVSSAGAVTFALGSSGITPENCYGWYITDTDDSNALLAACRFNPTPIYLFAPGQTLTITPSITGRTLGS